MEKIEELNGLCRGGKNGKFSLFDSTINPGERASLGLPLPELLGYAPLYLPVKVFQGKSPGPTALFFATMRGDEFNGMEILKQVGELSLLEQLRGTLLIVPVLNVYGLLNRSRFLPDGRELDHAFPGTGEGTYTERMARLFTDSLFDRCDFCVEICSGSLNHDLLPHLFTDCGVPGNRELAAEFPVSVVVDIDPEEGSLHRVARETGKPMLTYSAGEAMRFDRRAIRLGKRGLLRLLRRVGMLPTEDRPGVEPRQEPLFSEASLWVHATKSGIAHPKVRLGDRVRKGDTLAVVAEPFGSVQEVQVAAPGEGVVVGANDLPLVFEGEPLFRLARFSEPKEAADKVQEWASAGIDPDPADEPAAE
jgi:hypothetical protein